MPRSLWSTSSQDPLPRASAAAPAAAAVLTARQVLPRPGAPPVQSPPPAGPSEGQDAAPNCLHPPSRVEEADAQNLPHLMEPTSNTIWPDVESLDLSVCPGSIRSCCTLEARRGWRGLTGQRCPIRDCPGELGGVCGHPASSRAPRPPPIPGTVY